MTTREAAGVPIFVSGHHLDGYHRVALSYHVPTGQVAVTDMAYVEVAYPEGEANPVTPVAAVEAAVSRWEGQAEAALAEEIGHTVSGIARPSWELANWVTDSWLAAFPEADLALQNSGGLQAAIAPGAITVGDLVATMPFENYLYEVEMTGTQVRAAVTAMLNACAPPAGPCFVAPAGLTYTRTGDGLVLELSRGTPLVDADKYTVIVNNYVLAGGAGFPADGVMSARATGQHMRDPVIAWTRALGTSASDPLEDHLDDAPRGQ